MLVLQDGEAVSKESIEKDERMEAVTAAIIARGTLYSAADVYQAFADMARLSALARAEMAKVPPSLGPSRIQPSPSTLSETLCRPREAEIHPSDAKERCERLTFSYTIWLNAPLPASKLSHFPSPHLTPLQNSKQLIGYSLKTVSVYVTAFALRTPLH